MNGDNRFCLNCKTALHGEYCSHCGQRDKDLRLPVKELASEFIEVLPSFDERLIRSLKPFLFSPGTLTLEYLSGKRKRYISPFKFYFFISFLFFFVSAFHVAGRKQATRDGLSDSLQTIIKDSSSVMAIRDGNSSISFSISDTTRMAKLFGRGFVEGFKSGRNNPQAFFNKVKEHLPKILFLLLPVFALLLKAVYARSHILYIQHLVFSFNFHSFVFLILLIDTLFEMITPARFHLAGNFILAAIPVYLYAGLRTVYSQGRWKTVLKCVLLALSHFVVFILSISILVIATVLLFFM